MNTYESLDQNKFPLIGEICFWLRYDSIYPERGYAIDKKIVYIPFTDTFESVLNFKSFRPIDKNYHSF